MTIACTRCGASCDGDIIVPNLAFKFKHNKGCGHGLGPLAILPSNKKPKVKQTTTTKPPTDPELPPKSKPVDESPKKSKPIVDKLKSFGKKDSTTTTNTTTTSTTT